MTWRITLSPLLVLGLGAACATDGGDSLSPDEAVAMDAAVKSLDPVRSDLPIEDVSLTRLGTDFVNLSRADLKEHCDIQGIVSGVWYDADLEPVFEGSWFALGTGEQGGTIEGRYADGRFEGSAEGKDDVTADITGAYSDGRFVGEWEATNASGEASNGQMLGRYERRNEVGGYFFGLWGQCDLASVGG